MANTTIQLKFSTVTAAPTSLNIGEPAYSYVSNTFFIGSPSGTGAIAIGGKFYLDQQQIIFDTANAAFASANNVAPQVQPAFNTANAAFIHANAAFDAANTNAGNITTIQGVNLTQNTSITNLEGVNLTQNTNITIAQNSAAASFIQANAAFERANNSLNANTGGTITGSLTVTGNLFVQGNTTFVDTEILQVQDSLIKLANNNIGDTLDIGFYGQYNDGSDKYTGLTRGAASDDYFLFKGLSQDPAGNTLASGSITAANAATLIANVSAYKVTIGGQDIQIYADNAYAAANGAQVTADAAFLVANNNTGVNLTQNTNITTAQNSADAAFIAANNSQTHASQAFNHANAAFSLANGTALIANTDVTNVSITGGHFGSASQVAAFEVAANGRIISANATSIAISASAITSGILGVARGGTGADTFTTNGVLLGQGTSAFTTASSSTEGHVLTINDSGVPTFAMLQGGTF